MIIIRLPNNLGRFSMMPKKMFSNRDNSKSRGQSMVELALLFPLLLILLSGVIEFGFVLNQYLTLMDASRNAARFASDGLYYQWDNSKDCSITRHFYRQTACLVNQELTMEYPDIVMADPDRPDPVPEDYSDPDKTNNYLDPTRGDDIVVSVFSFTQNQGITDRHPGGDQTGWSYAIDLDHSSDKVSQFTSNEVTDLMYSNDAPNTGYVLVEVFYNYEHRLGLPWITAFIENPLPIHAYAFMPLTSAEPTPTPMP
jgi:hypothetical protein